MKMESEQCEKVVEKKTVECPYTIENSQELGRYLVATRDLEAREVIIEEQPLIVGPKDEKDDNLLCLTCCSRSRKSEQPCDYEAPILCSKCYWPVCCPKCEQTACHAENECRVFSLNKVHYPPPHTKQVMYKSIVVLRCILMKTQNPNSWERLMTMEDHSELRKNTPKCYMKDKKIVDNLKFFLPNKKIGEEDFPYDDSEVIKISGIIDVNSHSVPKKHRGSNGPTSECHIYLKTSLLSHSCVPNSSWRFTGLGHSSGGFSTTSTLTVRSNIPIKKGTMISVAYHNSRLMYGTLRRLIPMEMAGLFVCKCQRCLDPAELGAYLSGIKCQECEEGYLLPIDPVDSFSDWQCNHEDCQSVQIDTAILDIIEDVEDMAEFPQDDFSSMNEENVKFLMELVENYAGKVVHPNHYVIQEVNGRIIKYQQERSLDRLQPSDLQMYIDRCESMLKIADIVTPGSCEYRAFLLFHLSKGLLLQGKRRITEKEPWENSAALAQFSRVLTMQEEACQYLKENYAHHPGMKVLEKNIYDTKRFIMRLKVVA